MLVKIRPDKVWGGGRAGRDEGLGGVEQGVVGSSAGRGRAGRGRAGRGEARGE